MTNNNSNSIPANVTSYDTGNKPFKHDVGRGKWSKSWDFYAVALSHCFGFRHFVSHFLFLRTNAFLLILSYTFGMITFIIPLYYTQMFLGQFSSTGLISAFRISPLFKVIGYISLFLNILTCSYFMVTAAFPLYIMFETMQSNLPWTHCNNHYNTDYCTMMTPELYNKSYFTDFYMETQNISHPIREYIDYLIGDNFIDTGNNGILWHIMLCSFLVWALIGLVLFKGVEMLGKIFRFTTATMLICIILTTIRIFCVEESWEVLKNFFVFRFIAFNNIESLVASPILITIAFGAGWGNILTIASYNDFKEDIGKLSFVACFSQMIIFILTVVNYMAVEKFLREKYLYTYIKFFQNESMLFTFVSYAFYFSHLEWAHFWTFLFFLVIFISQFSEGALQMLTITTAIFDEYEYTRIYKKIILGGLIGIFGLISVLFCTTNSFGSVSSLYTIAAANKSLIILLELFVILWIYGRLRFQRDVLFMTGKPIKSWKVWMMRFFTPTLIIISFLYHLLYGAQLAIFGLGILILIFVVLKLLPILYIPGYMIYKVYSATGNILDRIKNLCRPNDWYPADPIQHQNYENYLGNSDIANELVYDNMENDTVHF